MKRTVFEKSLALCITGALVMLQNMLFGTGTGKALLAIPAVYLV